MDCIGIIGAMEEEVAALKEKMEQVEVTKKASMEFYRGVLEGKKLWSCAQELARLTLRFAHRF